MKHNIVQLLPITGHVVFVSESFLEFERPSEAMHHHVRMDVGTGNTFERKSGQILFSYTMCWNEEFPFAPDLTTYLHQFITAPWSAGRFCAYEEGQLTNLTLDERRVVEVCQALLDANAEVDEQTGDGDMLMAMMHAIGSERLSVEQDREVHWKDSSVKSSKFLST